MDASVRARRSSSIASGRRSSSSSIRSVSGSKYKSLSAYSFFSEMIRSNEEVLKERSLHFHPCNWVTQLSPTCLQSLSKMFPHLNHPAVQCKFFISYNFRNSQSPQSIFKSPASTASSNSHHTSSPNPRNGQPTLPSKPLPTNPHQTSSQPRPFSLSPTSSSTRLPHPRIDSTPPIESLHAKAKCRWWSRMATSHSSAGRTTRYTIVRDRRGRVGVLHAG